MKLVIDANRIMAALLKDGTSREIIIFSGIEFIAPEHAIEEIIRHKDFLLERSGLAKENFEVLIQLILQYIFIVNEADIKNYTKAANEIMKDIDSGDAPFVACALFAKADGIWSHDKHFDKQTAVKKFTNSDLVGFMKRFYP